MDRLFANGTVNAAQSGEGPPLFLFHSLLSDRASFDAIVPKLSQIVSGDRSGIAGLRPIRGGQRRSRRCRRPDGGGGEGCGRGDEAIVLGNGYGGFVALQMAIRHPGIATRLILADCGAAFSEPGREAFRNMAAASQEPRGWRRSPTSRCAGCLRRNFRLHHPDLMARSPRSIPENRP